MIDPSPDLAAFRCVRLRVVLRAESFGQLPFYLGPTLRGALGAALQRTLCTCIAGPEEPLPRHDDGCSFVYFFGSRRPDPSGQVVQVRRPYVILPPPPSRRFIEPGEMIVFHLTLLGEAAGFVPLLVPTLARMGRFGLGGPGARVPFSLERIDSVGGTSDRPLQVYSRQVPMVRSLVHRLDLAKAREEAKELERHPLLELNFLTPARLLEDQRLQDQVTAPLLHDRLMGRLCDVGALYGPPGGGGVGFHPSQARVDRRPDIRIRTAETFWVDLLWKRNPEDPGQPMRLGGVLGRLVLEGDLRPLLPYLVLGQWVHIGKNTTFGHGGYTLLPG